MFSPYRRSHPTRSGAFTLIEMMLTLALVALLYAMISTILVQIASYVRIGRETAEQRFVFLREIEILRYQLRCLHYPTSAVGMLGTRGLVKGRDSVRFLTTRGRKHPGVVEVGYKIEAYTDPQHPERGERLGLYYREFPFRRGQLRELDEFEDGRWELLLPDTELFALEYSTSGTAWQKEWDGTLPPRIVRLRLDRMAPNKDRIAFDVTPGEGAGRW